MSCPVLRWGNRRSRPHFLDAVQATPARWATSVIQVATNGTEFARSPGASPVRLCEVGPALRAIRSLTPDRQCGPTSHRLLNGNLFDGKLRAMENLWRRLASAWSPWVTGRQRREQRPGRVDLVRFALDNPARIAFFSFQPVAFTGRDETISDERRRAALHAVAPGARREADAGGNRRSGLATGCRSCSSLVVHRLGRSHRSVR